MSSEEQTELYEMNPPQKELRIVLVGKVGTGKTSSGNIILSETCPFPKPTSSFGLNTKKCQMESETIGDTKVTVVDTPGLCSISLSEEETVNQLKESITWAKPGPHVFLLVMRYGKVFTKEEEKTLEILQRTFGKNVMAYTLILFTHKKDVDKTSIDEHIDKNRRFRDLIIQCHWKYHAFNIKEKNDTQVTELLDKINDMVTNSKGCFYSVEMLEEAENAVKQQQEKEIKETEEPKSWVESLKMSGLIGAAAGCVMGYFVSGGELTATMSAVVGAVMGGILAMTLVRSAITESSDTTNKKERPSSV